MLQTPVRCRAWTLGIGMGLAALLVSQSAPIAAPEEPKRSISFITDVAPLLQENCFACHNPEMAKGKLDLTRYYTIRKGGKRGDLIAPGQPADSVLMKVLVAPGKGRMPPKDNGDPLPKAKMDVIAQWIREGGQLDPGLTPSTDLVRELQARWKPALPPAVYKHPPVIDALVFTPDSKKLAVGGVHEIMIWDLATTKLEKRIYTRPERTLGMAFLPDGKLAVVGDRPGTKGSVRIYDLDAGKDLLGGQFLDGLDDPRVLVKSLLDADDSMLALALRPDGQKLAAGGCDGMVRLWDLSQGSASARLEATILCHRDWVQALAFSADGKYLLTASRDKTVKVWDLATQNSILSFPEHGCRLYGAVLTPDGKIGASAGEDGQVRFWHAAGSPQQLGQQIRIGEGGHAKKVLKIAASPDPKSFHIATGSTDRTIRLWDPATGASTRTLTGHTEWVSALAFNREGRLLASGTWNGEVKIWQLSDGSAVQSFIASPGAGR